MEQATFLRGHVPIQDIPQVEPRKFPFFYRFSVQVLKKRWMRPPVRAAVLTGFFGLHHPISKDMPGILRQLGCQSIEEVAPDVGEAPESLLYHVEEISQIIYQSPQA